MIREILSATSFLSVLIQVELMPSGESICSPQKNLASALPIIERLLVCKVQFRALVLSVTLKITGYGSSDTASISITVSAAHQFMMTVTYSRQLIEMKVPCTIFILLHMQEGTHENFFWEEDMPNEA